MIKNCENSCRNLSNLKSFCNLYQIERVQFIYCRIRVGSRLFHSTNYPWHGNEANYLNGLIAHTLDRPYINSAALSLKIKRELTSTTLSLAQLSSICKTSAAFLWAVKLSGAINLRELTHVFFVVRNSACWCEHDIKKKNKSPPNLVEPE